ncbi:disease resistance protein Pik-2-like [Panicum virgatum]|uniref:AAA+ ATPase domain-containing protein n=1 Tax=Panicum virgatum TaxID=38727 RepID=A0A8T0P6Q9_PANVG|nr:disease resistance protein Pik-2-like [Panicum virgatum]KAG2557310.1 hypothetical protein PVAP13_8NG186806 [Panicum virgatum]
MELAAAGLGSLLPKLGTLLRDEYKLQKGVRGEIRFLQAEMESMQAALNRVSKQPAHQIDELNKLWVRDLKDLVNDIEDSVDAFKVRVYNDPEQAKPHSFRRFFDRTIRLLTKAKSRHHIADDIQDIKKRINEVSKRKDSYNTSNVVVQPDTVDIDPRMPSLYQDAAKLVGIDGPTQKLVDLLTRGEGVKKLKLRVVSIVGVAGLGKTTIANSMYERLQGQFESHAFVSVSLKPDMKQILSSILRQVSKDKCINAGEKDRDELLRSIREFLRENRYLIVIDDVWNVEAWEIIKCALIDKNVGSRVIVTTRNMDVAKSSSLDGEVYELDPLSDKDSRRLLCKMIFNEDDGIYSDMEEVTMKILKKCGGIPLAIITIASMLASMPKTKYEWYGVYNSMGSGLEKDKTLDNMRKILHLSYSDMPSYLKPCLLYLIMFPEDYNISRGDLVRLWVAEDFVDGKKGSNLYDTGRRYFNELVNRSMIQPTYINRVGVPQACRVHDMILDLIISLSAQENFSVIDEGLRLKSTVCKIRRMSLQGKVDGNRENSKKEQMILPTTVNISHVRSLIVLGNAVKN